ncbi:DUF2306 domain-containing protein [Nonlabens xiamenensis]|uniref:hypothetical protein n=1 Tax=Nonlabens xiamenensis TaxID=2341043 RepID=UPI000F6078A9|nr:hypothetical protein [Nonlabens xiamenensis]
MPHDFTGWLHTLAAVFALIFGTIILTRTKGDLVHRRIGRLYGICMLVVCITAFMIYRVHQGLGILHFFAAISSATLLLGMFPLYFKKWFRQPLTLHLSWMYWSVIGLYCAFAAEIFTRLPHILGISENYIVFYALIGVSSGFTGYMGSRYFSKKKKDWDQQFGC